VHVGQIVESSHELVPGQRAVVVCCHAAAKCVGGPASIESALQQAVQEARVEVVLQVMQLVVPAARKSNLT
jgi:hypothetical protein